MAPRPLKLEQLLEFNDYLSLTVQGGIPIVDALRLTETAPFRGLKNIQPQLIAELDAGRSLSECLRRWETVFSPQYCQIVESGEQSPDLGVVLKTFSDYLRYYLDVRRSIGLALLYPVLVVIMSYLLFVAGGQYSIERYLLIYDDLRVEPPVLLLVADQLFRHIYWWGWIAPVLLLAGLVSWWRSNSLGPSTSRFGNILYWIPEISAVIRLNQIANFTTILAKLLRHEIPFVEAIRIAVQAAGIEQFEKELLYATTIDSAYHQLPPYLKWIVNHSAINRDVRHAMEHAAEMYRRRARISLEYLKLLAPILFVVLVGGSVTLCYGLFVFYPFTKMLGDM